MSLHTNISSLLGDAKDKKTEVYLTGDNCDITFTSRILDYNDKLIMLKNTVAAEYIKSFVQSKAYSINLGLVLLKSDHIESNGSDICFPISEKTEIDETRQEKRIVASPDEDLHCKIKNPFDNQTSIKRSILDYSNQGMSIVMIEGSKLFETGVFIPEIAITRNGKTEKQVQGKVVYKKKLLNSKGRLRSQVGIQFI